jgi:hypothetical protein
MSRLVEQGKVQDGEVDQLELEAGVLASLTHEPLGDREADPARTGAGDDDQELGHAWRC